MQVVSYTYPNSIFQDAKNESEILEFLETIEIFPLLRKQNVIHSDVLGYLTLLRVNIFSIGASENFGNEFHLNEGNGMYFQISKSSQICLQELLSNCLF